MKLSKPITIAYFTCRKDPKINWFFQSLNRELKDNWNNIYIIIIDYWLQYDPIKRHSEFKEYYEKYNANVVHISPKPCALQGKYKVTNKEYFAASNARNTAFLNCKTDYIVCIDDLTVLKEGWIDVVKWGCENNYVIYGAYAKVKNLQCNEDGSYVYTEYPSGLDSRYNSGVITNDFATKVAGSWLFGCSFGLPLSLAYAVDGFDEACDGQGAEDYDFGIRIGRITNDIYYSKQMFTYEDDDLHFAPGNAKFIRESKMLTQNTLMKKYVGMPSDHAMLQHVIHNGSQPFLKNNLKTYDMNNHIQSLKNKVDWRDGIPYKDM